MAAGSVIEILYEHVQSVEDTSSINPGGSRGSGPPLCLTRGGTPCASVPPVKITLAIPPPPLPFPPLPLSVLKGCRRSTTDVGKARRVSSLSSLLNNGFIQNPFHTTTCQPCLGPNGSCRIFGHNCRLFVAHYLIRLHIVYDDSPLEV